MGPLLISRVAEPTGNLRQMQTLGSQPTELITLSKTLKWLEGIRVSESLGYIVFLRRQLGWYDWMDFHPPK